MIESLGDKSHFPNLVKVTNLKNAKMSDDHRFMSVIEFDNLRSFARMASDEDEAYLDVCGEAVGYLRKLAQGVMAKDS